MREDAEGPQRCDRCGLPVAATPAAYRAFARMHALCYHYAFDHAGVDVDEPCADAGCPSSVLHRDEVDPDRDALTREIEAAVVDGEVPVFRLSRYQGPGFLSVETAHGRYLVVVARQAGRR